MTAGRPVEPHLTGFEPLGQLLRSIDQERLIEARHRALKLPRSELINRCRAATAGRKRILAFVLNQAMTACGIPPAFRVSHLSSTGRDVNQAFDLLFADAEWLRNRHTEHADVVRYRRSRAIFVGSPSAMEREIEFAYFGGTRRFWKIVKSLRLTEQQQLECAVLRSAPIAKRVDAINAKRDHVFTVLSDDLARVRRTATFTDEEAKSTLFRRHWLWLSRAYTTGGPAAIAKMYEMLTGDPIDRKVVARQLQIIDAALKKGR